MEHNVIENTNTESDTDDEDVLCLMTEISRTLDQRTTGELEVFEVDGNVETVEFNMPPDEIDIEESIDDQDQPLQIDISGDKEIIIINEDILVQTTAKEAPETEQKAGNEEAASATSSSRASSRTRSGGSWSSTRSYTRGTGKEASPTLRAGSTSSDSNTSNSTIGNLTRV